MALSPSIRSIVRVSWSIFFSGRLPVFSIGAFAMGHTLCIKTNYDAPELPL
jgi:hypothetical protein